MDSSDTNREYNLTEEQDFEINKVLVLIAPLTIDDLRLYACNLIKQCMVQANVYNNRLKESLGGDADLSSGHLSLSQEFNLQNITNQINNMHNMQSLKDLIYDRHRFLIVQKILLNKMLKHWGHWG